MKKQKGFANIVLIVLVVVLAGAIGYFVLMQKWPGVSQTTQPSNQNSPNPVTLTPSSTPQPTSNTSQAPPAKQFTKLQSNFFSTDPAAIELIKGKLRRDIRVFADDPALIKGGEVTNSINSFEYKVISALRMIGMTRLTLSGNTYFGEVLLNKFQKLNKFEQSPFITSDLLEKIDSELVIRERKDAGLARQFPLYDRFTESSPNQPTRDHVAALYTISFQALPPHLIHWDKVWLEHSLKG